MNRLSNIFPAAILSLMTGVAHADEPAATRTSSWLKVVAQSSQYSPRDIAIGYIDEIFLDIMTNPAPQAFPRVFNETLVALRAAAEINPLSPMSALTPAAQDKIISSFANYLLTAASRDDASHVLTGAQPIISEVARIIMAKQFQEARRRAINAETDRCFRHPLNCQN